MTFAVDVEPSWCLSATFTVWPGFNPASTVPRSSAVGVAVPLTAVIRSPVFSPAFAAGDPAETLPT